MKKGFVLCLSMLLILASSLTSFANSNIAKKTTLKLDISTSKEDKEIIKQYKKMGDDTFSKENNNITMNISSMKEASDTVEISGDAVAKMFGVQYEFSFTKQELDIKYVKNKKFYTGTFDVEIDNNYSALVDITTMSAFSKTIISFTLLDLHDESNQAIMLYGDTFKEQIELYQQELAAAQAAYNDSSIIGNPLEDEEMGGTVSSAASKSKYEHVTNKSNSTLGGSAKDKQMMVMNVSKCDPGDFGSGSNGYEHIRIFTRSYNLPKVDPTVLLAKPISATVKFSSSSAGIMKVIATTPDTDSNAIQNSFQIFASVAANSGKTLLSNALLLVSILPSNTVTVSGKTATFKPSLKNLTSIDLPASTASSDAENNEKNGVSFVVAYLQAAGYSSATVTCSSSITYQVFLNTDRTALKSTGTATVSHSVDLN